MSSLLPIEKIRHSCAHVLAQAVLKKFPDAKLGIGPTIENGFYYDFDLPKTLSDDTLKDIEKEMKRILKEKQEFFQFNADRKKAESLMTHQPYKLELINDLNLDAYSFYENGPFLDLCKGPHVENTRQIPAFKLLSVSGAYWKGTEKNKMLQRIYGTAFHTKEELKAYMTRLQEAKKRDHRVLGKELDLFSLSETIGGGLVLWHPKGAFIRHTIETLWKQQHVESNYQLLYTPHIGKASLWEKSGHLDCYEENMFNPISIDNQDYFVRPMNCPFHIEVYKTKHHSYRELPIRYAELGTVYRFERSGVLHGLFRVRGFTQDDAHIICTPSQVESEISNVLQFCMDMLHVFGFKKINTFISTKPSDKAVGSDEMWHLAQKALENAAQKSDVPFQLDEGGGAFYGPKIDIKIEDAIGREWQCSTIQFDFNLPERFNMFYINKDGKKEQPIMIHRALLGSLERFLGILIEHYAGKFPLWLAPVQVKVLSVLEKGNPYCNELAEKLKKHNIRVDLDLRGEKIGYKVRQAIKEKVPYMIIIGQKEYDSNRLTIRERGSDESRNMSTDEFIELIKLNTRNVPNCGIKV